jgi:regulatory protein YycI of two-component signal transduction system YycFG
MDNRNTNKHKSVIKTIFFIIILIIIVFLFLRGCNKNIINDGIKIVDIKQSVDSFNNDTIFLNENLNKDKRYSYDITIHNYLDEHYYLYKVEIETNLSEYILEIKPKTDTI